MAVQYTSVRYQDQQTGRVLGQSQLPAGWLYQGKVQNVSQSASRPFLVFLNARSQDGIDQFMADTGECFVQINRMPMGAHQEGGFNQQLGTPMRRFQTPEQYLDLQVSTMFRGNQITLVQTLPLADMRDPNTERQRILAMAEQELFFYPRKEIYEQNKRK